MAYIALTDIQGMIPESYLTQALDDDRDGVIDAWTKVEADVAGEIDGILGMAYNVPFSPVPAVVKMIAKKLACEACYKRRGTDPAVNPWTADADQARKLLMSLAKKDIQLQIATPEVAPVASAAAIIVETTKLGSANRTLA